MSKLDDFTLAPKLEQCQHVSPDTGDQCTRETSHQLCGAWLCNEHRERLIEVGGVAIVYQVCGGKLYSKLEYRA